MRDEDGEIDEEKVKEDARVSFECCILSCECVCCIKMCTYPHIQLFILLLRFRFRDKIDIQLLASERDTIKCSEWKIAICMYIYI